MTLSAPDIAAVAAQTARLTRLGLPLEAGLRAAAAELPSRGAARAMRRLALATEGGQSLDQAFASLGKRVPEHLRELLTAGLRTGTLETLLDRYVAAERLSSDVSWSLRWMLAHASFYASASFALLLYFSMHVVGEFRVTFDEFDLELPAIMELFVGISKIGWRGPAAAFFLPQAVFWASLALRGDGARRAAFHFPLLGPIWHCQALGDFCQMLSLLTERDIPLPRALRLAGRGTPGLAASGACDRAARRIETGDDALSALQDEAGLAPTLSAVVPWANGSVAMSAGLRIAAAAYWRRARAHLKIVRLVLLPVTLFFVLSCIGVVVVEIWAVIIALFHQSTTMS